MWHTLPDPSLSFERDATARLRERIANPPAADQSVGARRAQAVRDHAASVARLPIDERPNFSPR